MCSSWGVLKNPLLLKMLCHFVLKNPELGSHTSSMEHQIPFFVAMGVKDMVEKYELFGGME